MNIIRAEIMGFCGGVRRAVELALNLESEQHIVTYGPIVHNAQVIERLQEQGVHSIESIDQAESCSSVVVRAHGVPPVTEDALRTLGAAVVDGTCPVVKKSQLLAAKAAEKGVQVVIVGDPGHGEVTGIAGYGGDQTVVFGVEPPWPLEALNSQVEVIAQTTITQSLYNEACSVIKGAVRNAVIHQTVCSATKKRQDAAKKLAAQCDAVLVVGGKSSSNTKRLTEICKSGCNHVWQIETSRDIPEGIKDFATVGITAGASTPDWIINEIEKHLSDL